MNLKDLVIKWNNSWRYDYWWRQKYKIAFNSEEHRASSQIDIAFEYFENHLSNEAVEKYKQEEDKRKVFEETGQWIRESETNKQKVKDAFDKLDVRNF